MALDKNDLKEIEKIVGGSEKRLNSKIDTVEFRLNKKIDTIETCLNDKIDNSENRIISIISREINDLAEINHMVIQRLDQFSTLEKRVTRLEHKNGIVS